MENKEINKEQIKVEKLFQRLYDKSVKQVGSTVVIAIFQFLSTITFLMPVQSFFEAERLENPLFMPAMLTMFSFVMVSMRAMLFREYTECQKARKMIDILKYYPVCRKELWKAKMTNCVSFMAKMTCFGLVLQIGVTLLGYKEISWMNFVYIILCVFVLPLLGELIFDGIMKTYVE